MEKKTAFYHQPLAFIYIRVSTAYQIQTDSNSFETQKRLCMDMCEKKNLPVAKIIEQVRSGRKDRKELVNVVKNELTKGDVIVVYSISRFARSQKQVHDLVDILMKKQCRLISVAENMDTIDDDKLLGIYAWVAEMESKQIAERVKVSLQSKKLRGEHLGNLPYGYQFQEGRGSPLVLNEEQQKILRMMRAWRAEGKSIYGITKRLNAQQVPTPKKTKINGWNELTVKNLIQRDDSKILTRGKRSWYEKQEQTEEPTDESPDEPTSETTPATGVREMNLEQKPAIALRTMLMKRRQELGLLEEEIRELSKQDMIEILQCV